jgi:hypothetical protein
MKDEKTKHAGISIALFNGDIVSMALCIRASHNRLHCSGNRKNTIHV